MQTEKNISIKELFTILSIDKNTISELPLQEKLFLLKTTNDALKNIKDNNIKKELNLETIKNIITKQVNKATEAITVNKADIQAFATSFLDLTNQENWNEILLPVIEKSEYKKTGLPLKISRQTFVQELSAILNKLPQEQQAKILKKLDIKLTQDKQGYDGLLQFNQLDENNSAEKEIKTLVKEFLLENEIQTGNAKTDKALNALIKAMPEFINLIGKKQHETHQYTVDIHTIKVLQEAIAHPEYKNLSNQDKGILKLAILLHDSAKNEGVESPNHSLLSALYTNNILSKFKLTDATKERIVEMVKFHHWFEEINEGRISPEAVATMFRNPTYITIAEIFTKADLMGVSEEFYTSYKEALKEQLSIVKASLKILHQGGNMIFSTQVLDTKKLPTETLNGVEYKVVDLTKISDDFDLRTWGLSISKKSEFRALNHCGDIETLKDLINPANESSLCVSLISTDKKVLFKDFNYGFMIETSNSNIANTWYDDQWSDMRRDFNGFVELIFEQSKPKTTSSLRTFQRDVFLKALAQKGISLSVEEYGELYKELSNKKHFGQIKDITINGKTINADSIIEAYKATEEKIMQLSDKRYNEINIYNPKIKGIIFVGNSLSEAPEALLKAAKKHNLPIFILGSRK